MKEVLSNPWLVFGCAFLVAMIVAVFRELRIQRKFDELNEKVSGEVVPAWQWFQTVLLDRFTPRTERAKELKRLLKDDPNHPMTEADRQEFLDGLIDGVQSEDQRKIAEVLPVVMRKAQEEAENPNPIVDAQVVGIKKPNGK